MRLMSVVARALSKDFGSFRALDDISFAVSGGESLVILGDESARDRVPEALRAISRRVRSHPRYKRLREVAEGGEPLTPWVSAWEK